MGLVHRSLFLLAAAGVFAPAGAHHSFAMYDLEHPTTVEGVVREFHWVNPHSSVTLVKGAPGAAQEVWVIEMTSPGNLTRALGITLRHNRLDLTASALRIEDRGYPTRDVIWSRRIGINVGTEMEWRCAARDSQSVSGGRAR